MGIAPKEHQPVDQAIEASEKLARESARALEKLREERERSEKVINGRRRRTAARARNGNGR